MWLAGVGDSLPDGGAAVIEFTRRAASRGRPGAERAPECPAPRPGGGAGGLAGIRRRRQLMPIAAPQDSSTAGVNPVPLRLGTALLLLALGCSGGLPGTGRLDLQRARIQVDSLNAKFVTWLAAEQLDSLATLYARDGVLMGMNAPPVEGRAAIRAAWAGMAASHRLQFVLQATDLLGGDSVLVERGRFALHMAPKAPADSGPAATDDRGSYVVVWVHREGRWQIKFDIAASDRAPAPGPGSSDPAPASAPGQQP